MIEGNELSLLNSYEFEESLVITNKKLSTTSEELPIPGAFKSDDEKEELFENEELVKKEPQLKIAIEEARFEEIVNSTPGAWNYAPLKSPIISQEQQLNNNLAEAMEMEEDSEDNEVFYNALEEQENNKEEAPVVTQQKAHEKAQERNK